MDEDVEAVVVELLLFLLPLNRGRLCERCLEPLKLFFLTKLMSVASSSSKAGVKAGDDAVAAVDEMLLTLLMDVADFSSGRP